MPLPPMQLSAAWQHCTGLSIVPRSLGTGKHSLLQHCLPLAKPGTDGKAVHSALDFGTPLPHIVLNVEQEGLLPKVGIHNLPRCL